MAERKEQQSTSSNGSGVPGEKKIYKQGERNPKHDKQKSDVPKCFTNILDIMGGKEFEGAGNLHGYNFQTKVICLYLFLSNDLKNVHLATEVKAAGKLDDLVLSYDKEGESYPSYCFLQAKQDEKSPVPKIEPIHLKINFKEAKKDPKFSLCMYFESYVEIRKQFSDNNIPLSSIEYLVMFTNADFNYKLFNVTEYFSDVQVTKSDEKKITLQKLVNPDSPLIPQNSYKFVISPKLSSEIFGDVDSQTLNEYLDKLVFSVNQPDFNHIDGFITQELSQKFNLLKSDDMANKIVGKMWNIYSQKVGREMSPQFFNFFDESRQEVNRPFFSGITFSERNDKFAFECYFTDTKLLSQFLAESKSQINVITSKTPTLTSVKAAQALQEIYQKRGYPELYFAVVDLPTLIKNKERMQDTFKRKKEFVLVIKLDDCDFVTKETVDDLRTLLADDPKQDPKKKLVFVCKTKVHTIKLELKPEICNRFEDYCNFSDITDNTKSWLMDHQIMLQGSFDSIGLADFIEEAYFESMTFNIEFCDRLTEVKDFKIGERINDIVTEEPYYVERRFNVNIRFGKHLKCLPSTELLLFSNTDSTFLEDLGFKKAIQFNDSTSKNITDCDVILLDASSDTTFKTICKACPSKNIHWFEKNGDSIDLLMSVLNVDLTEDDVMANPGKLKIITGEPGSGKSIVLTSVMNKIKEKPLSWVIRINLLDACSDLAKLKIKDHIDLESTLDLLCKAEKLESNYEKELLRYTITKTDQSYLFFDGFDEICPTYEETVLKLIELLLKTRAEIWVTTRPHFKVRLEEEFSKESYGLVAFSNDDQKSYLQRFWSKQLGPTKSSDAIADFVIKVSGIFTQSHIQCIGQFTRIPLLTQMLAVIYQEDCKKYCLSPVKELKIHTEMDILGMYDSFVDRKYTLFSTTKARLDSNIPEQKSIVDDYVRRFSEQHKKLAIQLLFQDDFESLVTTEVFQSPKEKMQLMDVGLLLEKNGKFSFIHRTFAEYFCAKHLADVLEEEKIRNSAKYQFVITLLRQQYFIQTNTTMRIFLDRQLVRNSEILKATVDDDLAQVVTILKKNSDSIKESDILGRTPWLLAAAYSRHRELPKCNQKSLSSYYQVFDGEITPNNVELLWNLKDNFDIGSVDVLGFNVICYSIAALDPNRKTVIFKTSKVEFEKV